MTLRSFVEHFGHSFRQRRLTRCDRAREKKDLRSARDDPTVFHPLIPEFLFEDETHLLVSHLGFIESVGIDPL